MYKQWYVISVMQIRVADKAAIQIRWESINYLVPEKCGDYRYVAFKGKLFGDYFRNSLSI